MEKNNFNNYSKSTQFVPHEIKWTEESVYRLWSYYATNRSYQTQYFSFYYGKYILRYVKNVIKLKRLKTILDFGCGPGYFLEYLLIKMSHTKRLKKYSNLEKLIHIEKLPLPFKEESIDGIFMIEVIEHLSNKELNHILEEMYRILKKGGYLIITTPYNEGLDANKTICPECGCIFHRWQHLRSWNENNLSEKLNKIGFTVYKIEKYEFAPFLKRIYSIAKRFIRKT